MTILETIEAVFAEEGIKPAYAASLAPVIRSFIGNMVAATSCFADQAEDLCESPIEKMLLVAYLQRLELDSMVGSGHGGHAMHHLYSPNHNSPDLTKEEPDGVGFYTQVDLVATQYKVESYRADMVVFRYVRDPDPFTEVRTVYKTPMVIVEADGHDFHERTKEQAQHDKERDRLLQTLGFRVLRFTGSEIYRDAAKCAAQINEFLEEEITRAQQEKVRRRRVAADLD